MKVAHANADAAAAEIVVTKRRGKRPVSRKTAKVHVTGKIHRMAKNLLAYVRSGFQAVYDKGYEFGAKLRRYSRSKVDKLLKGCGTNFDKFCEDSKKAGWYAMQAGKCLLIASAFGVIVSTVYGGVITIITAPVVMLAGAVLAASKVVGGTSLMNGLRAFMAKIAGRTAAPALRVVV